MKKKTFEPNQSSIFLKPTSREEIGKTVKELKLKSGGIDGINSKVLKCLANKISIPPEYIFNVCMNEGIWPEALKTAEYYTFV